MGDLNFYRPQTKFAKVMFLHVFVSHSVHRRGDGIPVCLAGLQAYMQGKVEGSGQGGLQAHTWGVSRPTLRGVCIPACTEADPSQQTAIAAGGTHPTGMHSCLRNFSIHWLYLNSANLPN